MVSKEYLTAWEVYKRLSQHIDMNKTSFWWRAKRFSQNGNENSENLISIEKWAGEFGNDSHTATKIMEYLHGILTNSGCENFCVNSLIHSALFTFYIKCIEITIVLTQLCTLYPYSWLIVYAAAVHQQCQHPSRHFCHVSSCV